MSAALWTSRRLCLQAKREAAQAEKEAKADARLAATLSNAATPRAGAARGRRAACRQARNAKFPFSSDTACVDDAAGAWDLHDEPECPVCLEPWAVDEGSSICARCLRHICPRCAPRRRSHSRHR